jgi:hypothetical protein
LETPLTISKLPPTWALIASCLQEGIIRQSDFKQQEHL